VQAFGDFFFEGGPMEQRQLDIDVFEVMADKSIQKARFWKLS
jgi:hypothetical protein